MKVLYLVDALDNGGLERQMALLATSLPEQWEPRVWAMRSGPFEAYLRARGIAVNVRSRGSRFDASVAPSLWRRLWELRPDVVHSWSWMSTLVAGPACRAFGIPLIDGTIQTGGLQPEFLPLKRAGMLCADLIVANNHAGLQAWGVGPAKGRVVYNSFDEGRLEEAVRGVLPATDKPFTVVMTGRMVPVKDFVTVIAAARILSVRRASWRFVLIGSGSDRDRLRSEAADLVQAGVVVFPRPGMEVLGVVARADVGVLMTNPALAVEGCSNSIMEYMAVGLPVVCSDGGGNRELVRDGVTGFTVPPADAGSLADRLAYLREHDAERDAMGSAGRARLHEEFSLATMVAGMLRVYAEAMG